jgi:RNA polymerase sigma factor (sigma-70 family)
MKYRQANQVIGWLRGLTGEAPAARFSDQRLLNSFVNLRDESAFAALMQRHGPMVLGVCRRVLRDAHDADDAFQATFLVLARRAGSITDPEALAGWLYRVAYRTSLKARSAVQRRRGRETSGVVADHPDAAGASDRGDERAIALDDELNRLPTKYRLPLVLCYLEGMSNDEAAAQLGCPVGTLQSQLSRARQRLRVRLARRGLEAPASALLPILPLTAPPATLITATARAAVPFAVGDAGIGGLLSTSVVELAEEGLKTMFLAKLKISIAILLILGGVGAAVGVAASRRSSVPPAVRAITTDLKKETLNADTEKRKQAELRDRKRLQEQIQIAREVADARFKEYAQGQIIMDILFESARSLRDVELEASKTKAERVEALQHYLTRMKDIEDLNQTRLNQGRMSQQDWGPNGRSTARRRSDFAAQVWQIG